MEIFTKVKRFKEMEWKHRNQYQRLFLLDEVTSKWKLVKQLNKILDYEASILNKQITWMKRFSTIRGINFVMNIYKKYSTQRRRKSLTTYINKQKKRSDRKFYQHHLESDNESFIQWRIPSTSLLPKHYPRFCRIRLRPN